MKLSVGQDYGRGWRVLVRFRGMEERGVETEEMSEEDAKQLFKLLSIGFADRLAQKDKELYDTVKDIPDEGEDVPNYDRTDTSPLGQKVYLTTEPVDDSEIDRALFAEWKEFLENKGTTAGFGFSDTPISDLLKSAGYERNEDGKWLPPEGLGLAAPEGAFGPNFKGVIITTGDMHEAEDSNGSAIFYPPFRSEGIKGKSHTFYFKVLNVKNFYTGHSAIRFCSQEAIRGKRIPWLISEYGVTSFEDVALMHLNTSVGPDDIDPGKPVDLYKHYSDSTVDDGFLKLQEIATRLSNEILKKRGFDGAHWLRDGIEMKERYVVWNHDVILKSDKKCSHCGTEKPLYEFNRRSASIDGRQSWCRECQRKRNEKNNEKRNAENESKAEKKKNKASDKRKKSDRKKKRTKTYEEVDAHEEVDVGLYCFLYDYIEQDEPKNISIKKLYAEYKNFILITGADEKLTKRNFCKQLGNIGLIRVGSEMYKVVFQNKSGNQLYAIISQVEGIEKGSSNGRFPADSGDDNV